MTRIGRHHRFDKVFYVQKMKHFIITLLALCALFTSAHAIEIEIPDMEKIEEVTQESNSPYYYPDLMKKFQSNDTSMTLQEFRHLYLGYAFQEDYNPYRTATVPSQVEQLYSQSDHSREECDELIKHARKILSNIPFNLRQINILIYALRQKEEFDEANLWEYRLNGIMHAILSTGDGKAPETAWYVIFPADEYNVVNRQGFTATEFTFVEPYFDYITVEKNPLKAEGFYFNVQIMLKEYNRKYYER